MVRTLEEYVVGFVMAGGRGTRLKLLTRDIVKPAVGILGKYRIFDFVATNIANSDIPVMLVATQFEPRSLHRHVGDGRIWDFDGRDKTLEILPPYQTGKHLVSFEGTASSVRENLDVINRYNPHIALILGGDHIYCMNYQDSIQQHRKTNADVTVMANGIPREKVSDFGIMKIDEQGRILGFAEKPSETKQKDLINGFALSERTKKRLGITDQSITHLASMGNYVFDTNKLNEYLKGDYQNMMDFGSEIIPAIKYGGGNIYAWVFKGYWRDVGKLKDYFDCNLEFCGDKQPIDLLTSRILTAERPLPSAYIAGGACVSGSILSPGDEVHRGSKLDNVVAGYQVIIEEGCTLDNCVLLGADRNEYFNNEIRRKYDMQIGKGSNLSHVIFDKM
jgi:glucose-1-phosphate adenylyltransferase